MPIGSLAATCIIILMYVAGFVMSLIGPDGGQLVSFLALPAMMIVWLILLLRIRRGTFVSVMACNAAFANRFRHVLGIAIAICFVTVVVSIATSFLSARFEGVASGSGGPLLETRATYELNNHGQTTEVSRARFLTVGISGLVIWHVLGLMFATYCLHILVLGYPLPWRG